MVTATRLRATASTDAYGDTVEDWATPDEFDLYGGLFAPVTAPDVDDEGRHGVVVGWQLFLPGIDVLDVKTTDRIRVDADVYLVDGEPAIWNRDGAGGAVVSLQRFEG